MPTPYQAVGMPNAPASGERTKSVQRGVALMSSGANSVNVAISPVNMAKSEVRYLGFNDNSGGSSNSWMPYLSLVSSTILTITRSGATSGITAYVSWEITEKY